MTSSELDIEAIRRRVPDVYTAPWTVTSGAPADDNWHVAYTTSNPLAGLVATVPDYGVNLADFIAHAREDIPALIAEVERLRTGRRVVTDMPCDCTHRKDGHEGRTYACRHCGCKRYTPDIQEGSTSAQLRQAQTALAASQADLTRAEQERDEVLGRYIELADHYERTDTARMKAETELASACAELQQLRAQLAGRGAP